MLVTLGHSAGPILDFYTIRQMPQSARTLSTLRTANRKDYNSHSKSKNDKQRKEQSK